MTHDDYRLALSALRVAADTIERMWRDKAADAMTVAHAEIPDGVAMQAALDEMDRAYALVEAVNDAQERVLDLYGQWSHRGQSSGYQGVGYSRARVVADQVDRLTLAQ